nr:MAG TPA: N-deoxyribosyltransferase [Caudoviricetes sp.]
MKIYISGAITDPTTGKPRADFASAFNSAATYLKSLGHEPVNPADPSLASKANGTQWVDYIARDVKLVSECDGIYFLAGWMPSTGSQIEKLVAEHLGKRVFYPHCPPEDVKQPAPKAADAKK